MQNRYSILVAAISLIAAPAFAQLLISNGANIDMTGSTGSQIIFPDGTMLASALGDSSLPAGHGGTGNLVEGADAFIGGGKNNSASLRGAAVGGGQANAASARFSLIGGGRGNAASGDYSSVGGGIDNSATDKYATVAGGWYNSAGDTAVVSGGRFNVASGMLSMVPGGSQCEAQGGVSLAAGFTVRALHDNCFVWGDGNIEFLESTGPDQFIVEASGGVWFGATHTVSMTNGARISTDTGAYLSDTGVWTDSSDRHKKDEFENLDSKEILERVAALPIHEWSFRGDKTGARHIGPTAQDFHQAFGLGATDTHIAALDTAGVALAAIQGINAKFERVLAEKQAYIRQLEERLAVVEEALAKR